MKHFVILERKPLEGIFSASGMAETPNGFLIACDDRPFLFEIDLAGKNLGHFPITDEFAWVSSPNVRVPKAVKRDFEAIASWEVKDKSEFLVFGSGSVSKKRSYVARLEWQDSLVSKGEKQLQEFYDALVLAAGIGSSQLNIEGATVLKKELFLFNRELGILFRLKLADFLDYWEKGGKQDIPEIEVHRFEMPSTMGVVSGFSGATTDSDGKIWFSASAEATENWVDDGRVAGSFIGWLDDLGKNAGPKLTILPIVDENGAPTNDKVEALSIFTDKNGEIRVIALTDSDGGQSEMLILEMR